MGELTDGNGTLSDHGTVNLVDDVIDQDWVEGVRDDLVSGDDVLRV